MEIEINKQTKKIDILDLLLNTFKLINLSYKPEFFDFTTFFLQDKKKGIVFQNMTPLRKNLLLIRIDPFVGHLLQQQIFQS